MFGLEGEPEQAIVSRGLVDAGRRPDLDRVQHLVEHPLAACRR